MNISNNKRYIETEARIHLAFEKLLSVKSFNEITVNNICNEAGISRPSFYAHYEDIIGYDATISVDFTGKGGDFAAWVGGHTHKDMHQMRAGILAVCAASDSLVSAPNCKANTTDEQAFDIFTIDKAAHKIHITRIGRGADREFTYDVF